MNGSSLRWAGHAALLVATAATSAGCVIEASDEPDPAADETGSVIGTQQDGVRLLWRRLDAAGAPLSRWTLGKSTAPQRRADGATDIVLGAKWRVVGAVDLDDDGYVELVAQDGEHGPARAFLLDDREEQVLGGQWLPRPDGDGWRLGAVADFDHDGVGDLVWRKGEAPEQGRCVVLLLGDDLRSTRTLEIAPEVSSSWHLRGAADADADGTPDLLWQNETSRKLAIWRMSWDTSVDPPQLHRAAGSSFAGPQNTRWQVRGFADASGDGRADILWFHGGSGKAALWFLNASATARASSAGLGGADPERWTIAGMLPERAIRRVFEFGGGAPWQGWRADITDLLTTQNLASFAFESEIADLPGPLEGAAIRLQSTNRSDDAWMYAAATLGQRIDPDRHYLVRMRLWLATRGGEAGAGGSPATSVFVKVGASGERAEPVQIGTRIEFSLDKGNQSQLGSDALAAGTLACGGCDDWTVEDRRGDGRLLVRSSGAPGTIDVFVGTDSGFEGTTEVYYDRVEVLLQPL